MSDVKQIGVVGNAIHISQLPEANAFTYGEGNRFYTLENAQDGYISGHTYRTLLSDGVYSWIDVDDYGATDTEGTAIVDYLKGAYSKRVIDKNGQVKILYGLSFAYQDITEAYFPNVSQIGVSRTVNNIDVEQGGTFYACYSLKKIYFPECTSILGSYNFAYCGQLERAEFPKLSGTLQGSTFSACSNLSYVNINTSYIGYGAFSGCSNLEVAQFGDVGISYVSAYGFANCSKLSSVHFNSVTVSMSDAAFSGCGFVNLSISCTSWIRMSSSAFANNTKLETVDLSAYGIFLGYSRTFGGCYRLSNIKLTTENGITFSATSMFQQCSSLRWGDLSSAKITAINGRGIFSSCWSLNCVYAPNLSLLSGDAVFSNCSNLRYWYLPIVKTINCSANATWYCRWLGSIYIMQESGLLETDVPTLSTANVFTNGSVGYYVSGRHPWIYVGYSEYLPWIQAATNWVNISSYILVSQFSST